jgi:hypothetical protein
MLNTNSNSFTAETQRTQRNAEEKRGKGRDTEEQINSLLCVPLRSLRLCGEVS